MQLCRSCCDRLSHAVLETLAVADLDVTNSSTCDNHPRCPNVAAVRLMRVSSATSERTPNPYQAQLRREANRGRPSQERLLVLLFRYQRDFAASKLVVGRKGELFFDDPERRKSVKINFLTELYGSKDNDTSKLVDFISLMESLPTKYVRFHAEARLNNPFVVSLTPDGVKYLRKPK